MNAKDLINRIRECESNVSYAVKTNEKELPRINVLLDQLVNYPLAVEDKDIEVRLTRLKESVGELKADNLSSAQLSSLQSEVDSILDTLCTRYQERLEAYANRFSNI